MCQCNSLLILASLVFIVKYEHLGIVFLHPGEGAVIRIPHAAFVAGWRVRLIWQYRRSLLLEFVAR